MCLEIEPSLSLLHPPSSSRTRGLQRKYSEGRGYLGTPGQSVECRHLVIPFDSSKLTFGTFDGSRITCTKWYKWYEAEPWSVGVVKGTPVHGVDYCACTYRADVLRLGCFTDTATERRLTSEYSSMPGTHIYFVFCTAICFLLLIRVQGCSRQAEPWRVMEWDMQWGSMGA